jgi:hypothetical protein
VVGLDPRQHRGNASIAGWRVKMSEELRKLIEGQLQTVTLLLTVIKMLREDVKRRVEALNVDQGKLAILQGSPDAVPADYLATLSETFRT